MSTFSLYTNFQCNQRKTRERNRSRIASPHKRNEQSIIFCLSKQRILFLRVEDRFVLVASHALTLHLKHIRRR